MARVHGTKFQPLMSLEEVAQRLYEDGDTPTVLSHQRVQQIQDRALTKLTQWCKARCITLHSYELPSEDDSISSTWQLIERM